MYLTTRKGCKYDFALTFWLIAVLVLAGNTAQAQKKKVNAVDEISGAGYKRVTTTDASGHLPPSIKLPAGATSVTFAVTKGDMLCGFPCVSMDSGINWNDADGLGSQGPGLNLQAEESISGIQAPVDGFLTGVFESGPPSGGAPPSLNFNTIGTNFPSLSPVIQQLFFIGDGLTGDRTGNTQVFYVPSGATKLYLGIPDACFYNGPPSCYYDNEGYFTVSYAISTQSRMPKITLVSPASGKAGSHVSIWGYNLRNVKAVTFNGVPGQFKVENTLVDAIVPYGATTGAIEVTTLKGTASEGYFTVEP